MILVNYLKKVYQLDEKTESTIDNFDFNIKVKNLSFMKTESPNMDGSYISHTLVVMKECKIMFVIYLDKSKFDKDLFSISIRDIKTKQKLLELCQFEDLYQNEVSMIKRDSIGEIFELALVII